MSTDIIKDMEEIRDKLKSKTEGKPIESKSKSKSIFSSKKTKDIPKEKSLSIDKLKKDTIKLYSIVESYKLSTTVDKDDENKLKFVEEKLKMINKLPLHDKSKLESISTLINSLTNIKYKDLNDIKDEFHTAYDQYLMSTKKIELPKQVATPIIISNPPAQTTAQNPSQTTDQNTTGKKGKKQKQTQVQFNITPSESTPAPDSGTTVDSTSPTSGTSDGADATISASTSETSPATVTTANKTYTPKEILSLFTIKNKSTMKSLTELNEKIFKFKQTPEYTNMTSNKQKQATSTDIKLVTSLKNEIITSFKAEQNHEITVDEWDALLKHIKFNPKSIGGRKSRKNKKRNKSTKKNKRL